MALGVRGIVPANTADLMQLAVIACKAGLAPRGIQPIQAAGIIAFGLEVGFSPIQALSAISFINGKAAVYGDGLTALLHASGKLRSMKEDIRGDGDDRTAFCELWRHGMDTPSVGRFSVREAKAAGLWGKNVWASYPDRMLTHRARGWAARDGFSDVLRGLWSAEEAQDLNGGKPQVVARSLPMPDSRSSGNPELDKIAAESAKILAGEVVAQLPAGSPWPPEPKQVYNAMQEYAKPPVAKQAPSQATAKPANEQEPRRGRAECIQLMARYLADIFPDSIEARAEQLEITSSFTGKDGVEVKGFRSLKNAPKSDGWVWTTYKKIKDMWLQWEESKKVVAQEVPEPVGGDELPEADAGPDTSGPGIEETPF